MSTETTELGLVLEMSEAEVAARGIYDATRTPESTQRLVAFLLGVPGMRWDQIGKTAGIAWETVAAIARVKADSIREFKTRLASNVALIIEAATPGIIEKAKDGKVSVFDLKLLADTWLLLAGEATSRQEVVHTVSPELDEIRRLLAAKPVQEMGSVAAEIVTIAACAAGPPHLGDRLTQEAPIGNGPISDPT